MKRMIVALLVCLAPLSSACGGHEDAPHIVGTATDEAKAYNPIPYVEQYAGTYTGVDANGEVATLELTRTAKYTLKTTDGWVEKGSWRGPSKIGAPIAFAFLTSGFSWKGTITGYNGPLIIDRGAGKETLSSPIPNDLESLCGDTHGAWRDDDANPATGLYCDCPKKAQYWLPGEGGCVAH